MTLAAISTGALRAFEAELAARRVTWPASTFALQSAGFAALVAALEPFKGLSQEALLAALRCVLAERDGAGRPPELVWTGPEARSSAARDTGVVLADLFGRAQQRVLLAGFTFDHADVVLRPLWESATRGVTVRLFVDKAAAPGFATKSWPFGPPLPELYAFEPKEGVFASLHAKCVVVDGRWSFITSANFTNRGQTRNVEVGALLDDATFAESLERQLQPGAHFVAVTR